MLQLLNGVEIVMFSPQATLIFDRFQQAQRVFRFQRGRRATAVSATFVMFAWLTTR